MQPNSESVSLRDAFFFSVGLAFLALAKAKNLLRGFTTPKATPLSSVEQWSSQDSVDTSLWALRTGFEVLWADAA
jgi:hypothetical protein